VVVEEVGGVEEAWGKRLGGGGAEEGGEVAGVAEVEGGRGKEGGGRGRRRGARVGRKLLDESAAAAGAEDVGVRGCGRGDGDVAVALVAVEAQRRRGGRHGRRIRVCLVGFGVGWGINPISPSLNLYFGLVFAWIGWN